MHAYQQSGAALAKKGAKGGCAGGGHMPMPARSNKKEGRVDQADRGGWRGVQWPGCEARTVWLPTGDVLCPRCVEM